MSTILRHPMKTATGLGSARSGADHWWMQRVTSVVLAPLSVWFLWHARWLFLADHASAAKFVGAPLNATLLLLFTGALLYHAYLGLQVVIEDYVKSEARRRAYLLAIQSIYWGLGLAATFSIVTTVVIGRLVLAR